MFNDTDDDLIERNFTFFVLKIFALIGLNLFLSEKFEAYNNLVNVIIFNSGAICLWFALWLEKTSRLYQKNLRKLPTTAKSAETPESREKDRRYREMTRSDACNCKKTGMRELQW
ncbi:MAG: hypothetical protein COV32_00755 [Candidatus Yonathbacteria bacterium CG10_big_fil_rev_8_21_14_0_10_43_136]|uniref:Uncharacterized protein n=1 Tax=Candidatus Yonathbacteria bacterium CG_4_10_14_0_8_um_filter_43_17 TaxID=1975099 RepID=A0A2M7Q4D6_9BACT|nr:MAG: hypothetical protein COW60_02605 [Candidatus Yonathbacteria bacterium CG17_big_fil_post_rev_8_21_14_2_50_43_9]PIR40961.1 MAG: hypothetical protein COV32_00755 [Candidatus Yonathbacteria bacterium CG10_big_fil_rev_8_21_14_0_10_43_136]PIX57414.1 MAG: hypothetical protein COZ48_01005 [Candidatus Yonathbacteria bacterium CG_4_10_14_3_um_filter_43_12]PIY58243.1 MAG: hypothetical protein COY98_02370 [Candidatus Yonathbacteria bacterium CG_4_10_14_0_8_um_filter_43_17]PJC21838.1 MAG: hypothetic